MSNIFDKVVSNVTTTPLQTQTINFDLSTYSGSAVALEAKCLGYNTSNGQVLYGEALAVIRNVSGTLTVAGSNTLLTFTGDAALLASVMAFGVSGTNAQFSVTGIALITIAWQIVLEASIYDY